MTDHGERTRLLVASLLIVWGLGCLPRVSRQRLPERAKVAVAFVVDASATGSAFPAPEALERAIVDELAEHNLEAVKVPAEALASQRLSDGRFDALGKAAGAPFALLVEQRVRFFSQLDGRYRWEVSTTLTASASGGAVSRASFGIPVTLMYDHEKEPEAIASVAADIAGRVGTLMDGVLLSAAPVSTPVQPPVVVTSPRSTGIYFVMVDRFSDGDRSNDGDSNPADSQAFHGGDLQGVIDHLDWIQSLGFDTVWLSPIFKMRTEKWHGYGAFHGYWTWDLAALEPRFGDELLLARLRSELDRRKMKLMLDVVLNHVGPDAPLLTSKPGWFHKRGGVTDWNDATQLVMNDVHGLPDLATEQDEVFQYLLAAARRWVRVARPDGFRLDAVKHLPLEFWAKFNGSFDLVLLGELLDGDPGTIARTWREGHFTSMFDFPLGFAIADVFCRGESPAKLAAVLTSDRRYPDPSQLVTLVDNHDLPRILSQCGGDVEKVKQALAFLISMRGTPSLLWGTEVGLDGAKEPDNRKSMRFVEHPLREHIAKWMKLRAESAALSTGAALPVEVSRDRTVIARIAADGTTVNVKIEAGKVTLEDAAKSSPELVTQWRTGARTKRVTISGSGSVVGSGAELGDWDRKKAKPLPLTVDLPINGVFEFKRIINGDWEPGPNRLLFVTEATAGVSL